VHRLTDQRRARAISTGAMPELFCRLGNDRNDAEIERIVRDEERERHAGHRGQRRKVGPERRRNADGACSSPSPSSMPVPPRMPVKDASSEDQRDDRDHVLGVRAAMRSPLVSDFRKVDQQRDRGTRP
jgi:hypothetical protein